MKEDRVKKQIRQKTAELLKVSEVRYRRLFETAQDGILILDAETGQIRDVNPFLLTMLGYSYEEFLGKKLWEIGLFKDIADSKDAFEELQNKEYIRYEDLPLETKGGKPIAVEFVSNVYQIDHEKVIQCNIRDITARKKAEKALQELEGKYHLLMDKALVISEETLRLVVESLIVGITVTDLKGTILQTNQAMVLLLGLHNKEEVIGRNTLEFIDKIDRARAIENMNKVKVEGYYKDVEFTLLMADGSNFAAELSAAIIKDTSGTPQGIVFIVRDITERKREENTLRESKERYKELADFLPQTVFEIDETGNFTFANRYGLESSGHTQQDINKGLNALQLFIPEDRNRVRENIRRTLDGERLGGVAYTAMRKDGSTFPVLSYSATVIREGRPDGLRGLIIDITELKRAESELKLSNTSLDKAMHDIVQAMAVTCEMRDPYTAGHQLKVAKLVVTIAEELCLSDKDKIGLRTAAFLHDIGKMSVPSEILSKPGKLTTMEFALIKEHVQASYDILRGIDFPWPVAQIVLQHHERMDGSGYPKALSGKDIKLEARILAVADVVEAMTSRRPYRPALGIEKALEEISNNRGKLYDADIVDACLKLFIEKDFKFE